jgi:hypothetical protein
MTIILQPTILDSATLASAEAYHHAATVARSGWLKYWSRSPEVILADMAADLPKTLAVFSLSTQSGLAVNALLDAINDERFTNRAPVELPPHWSFDGTAFVYAPPAPEIPEP